MNGLPDDMMDAPDADRWHILLLYGISTMVLKYPLPFIFSPAEFDIRSLKKKNGTSFKFHEGFWAEEIYSCDIFDWAMHFGCYPAREEQMELLYKFRFEYDETQKILDYHHIAARPLEAKALCSQKYNGAYTSCDIYDLKEGMLSRNHRLSSVVGNPAAQIKPYAWCPLIL